VADEKTTLEGMLDHYRALLLEICSGLSEEQLQRPMVPSGTSLLGIIKHLSFVERGWFQENVGNEVYELPFDPETDSDGDWRIEKGETADDVFSMYRASIEKSRGVMAQKSLDFSTTWWTFQDAGATAFDGFSPTCSRKPRGIPAMPTS
jgi:uncharacterized damage-inducible protein DinB